MKTIDYANHTCLCTCDECGLEETIHETDYTSINDKLKELGWVIKCIDGEWYEFCSKDCYHDYKQGL